MGLKGRLIMIKEKMAEHFTSEDGMGVVEVVLIVLVLVGLAFIFKTNITQITNGILGSVKNQVGLF